MVRPIDLLFQRDASMRSGGMDFTPRVTYGSTEPVSTNPLRITINPSGMMPKPRLQTPGNTTSLLGANTGGTSMFNPATFGLLGASAELLRQGGFSKTPVSFGEGIGNAFNAGLKNYIAMNQAQQKMNQPLSVPKGGVLIDPKTRQVLFDGRNQGGMFTGSGLKTDVYNTLIELNAKIQEFGFDSLDNTEKAKYRLAYGNASKPYNETISTPDGGTRQIQRPAQNLTGFFNPFPDQQSGTTTIGGKPSPKKLKFIEQKPKLFTMLSNLNKYKTSLKDTGFFTQLTGAVGFPKAEATKLRTEAEALRLNIKDLEELGALVGGDFQILANRLTSPTTSEGLRIGKEGLLVQLESLENQILDKLQEGGFTDATGALSDPIPANDPKVWNEGRFGLYYKLPNGRVVLKQRKLK